MDFAAEIPPASGQILAGVPSPKPEACTHGIGRRGGQATVNNNRIALLGLAPLLKVEDKAHAVAPLRVEHRIANNPVRREMPRARVRCIGVPAAKVVIRIRRLGVGGPAHRVCLGDSRGANLGAPVAVELHRAAVCGGDDERAPNQIRLLVAAVRLNVGHDVNRAGLHRRKHAVAG